MKKPTLGQTRFLMSISAALSLILLPVSSVLDSAVLLYLALGSFLRHYLAPLLSLPPLQEASEGLLQPYMSLLRKTPVRTYRS